jgi:hypothetical protein
MDHETSEGDGEHRVCTRCGADAHNNAYCGACGLDLREPGRATTKRDWYAARAPAEHQAGVAGVADDAPAAEAAPSEQNKSDGALGRAIIRPRPNR